MASKLAAKHHVCSNKPKYTISERTMDYVRYTHGAQFMLIGPGNMTTLASLPTRSLMTSRRASANETRRSQKGGLVARGPEFNTGKQDVHCE